MSQSYMFMVEVNDLTANVIWANIPDVNVPESAVTQHEAALAILTSQLSGVLDDARVQESNVTQHEAALAILTSQLSGVLADARVQESNVTQHEAALAITRSQITDMPQAATADLEDITHAINTDAAKVLGYAVLNTDTGVLCFASGDTDGAVWHFYDSTTAHTPI